MKKLLRNTLIGAAALCASGLTSAASIITVDFEGYFKSSSSLFNNGDKFSGYYSLETTTAIREYNGFKYYDYSVTEWRLSVDSTTAIGNFSLFNDSKRSGYVATKNDDPISGDRYIVTLFDDDRKLPNGSDLNFFQLDFQDPVFHGSDMLSSTLLTELPQLGNASHSTGRFFMIGAGAECEQCRLEVSSIGLSPVPVPAALPLFATALAAFGWMRRRKQLKIGK